MIDSNVRRNQNGFVRQAAPAAQPEPKARHRAGRAISQGLCNCRGFFRCSGVDERFERATKSKWCRSTSGVSRAARAEGETSCRARHEKARRAGRAACLAPPVGLIRPSASPLRGAVAVLRRPARLRRLSNRHSETSLVRTQPGGWGHEKARRAGRALCLAPPVGFEPTTNGLTVRCATAAPQGSGLRPRILLMERTRVKPLGPRGDAQSQVTGPPLGRRSAGRTRPVP